MKKLKKFLTSPKVSLGAFVLAAGLLLFSSIGGARAALTYYSDNYVSRVQMHNIGVTLVENGTAVSDYGDAADGNSSESTGALLQGMVPEGEEFKLGKKYSEELCVQNTGSINEYVRVSIYKYWKDEQGAKMTNLSPDLIDLNLVNIGSSWLEDTEAKTAERTVLYYSTVLGAGQTTALFADTLTVDGAVATKVKQEKSDDGTIKAVYEYNGVEFCVEAAVDAVQEHNGQDAIWSAWGRRVTVSGGNLSLS